MDNGREIRNKLKVRQQALVFLEGLRNTLRGFSPEYYVETGRVLCEAFGGTVPNPDFLVLQRIDRFIDEESRYLETAFNVLDRLASGQSKVEVHGANGGVLSRLERFFAELTAASDCEVRQETRMQGNSETDVTFFTIEQPMEVGNG